MENPTTDTSMKDPQDRYDADLLEYTNGQAAEVNDDAAIHQFKGRFPRDFYKYSQDFHDREDGAPGIDQDFGTASPAHHGQIPLPTQMPEGGGVSESVEDRSIREEVVASLARDFTGEADDVTVRVEDGIVTLSGTVETPYDKKQIEDSVQAVPGVDEVVDCLLLSPPKF